MSGRQFANSSQLPSGQISLKINATGGGANLDTDLIQAIAVGEGLVANCTAFAYSANGDDFANWAVVLTAHNTTATGIVVSGEVAPTASSAGEGAAWRLGAVNDAGDIVLRVNNGAGAEVDIAWEIVVNGVRKEA